MSNESASISEEPSTSSSQSKKADTQPDKTFARYRSLVLTECGFKITTTENYLKRLQNLRKELNYISETEWMYDSLERKPPQ